MTNLALLLLKDGTEFWGTSIGYTGITSGELVFNTSITGYQEIITDPSYYGQIIAFTYPHIGNVGVNNVDIESYKIQVKGIIIRNASLINSNFRSLLSLSDYLKQHNIIGITNIDTRKLTQLLRKKGTQYSYLFTGNTINNQIIQYKSKNLNNINIIKNIGTNKKYIWTDQSYYLFKKSKINLNKNNYNVIVYDYGIKNNILLMLANRGCKLTIVPAETSANNVLKMKPDGIFLSNGPGDPSLYDFAINNIKIFLNTNIPIFGICLGHQLLALANNAKTIKMKFGHHGSNHPVKNHITGKVMITSQNHGFVVDKRTLPSKLKITHSSLFDGTLQGLHHISKPFFGFQGHPEGSPGPHDSSKLFDYFIELISIYFSSF